MVSMRVGAVISIVGALTALTPIMYFITLPLDSPTRKIFTQQILGLSAILYFTIAGAVITAIGLLLFMRAARAPPEVAYPSPIGRRPVASVSPAARQVARAPSPTPGGAQEGIVTEIEREIERIVQLEEEAKPPEAPEPEGVEAREEAVVEVVNAGQDMVCPHCGELNKLKSVKCAKCKKNLYEAEEGEPRCPVCDAPLRLSKKITEDLFACGLCFSELRIPAEVRERIGLE